MNNKRDYYEVLGVSRAATEQDIKSAYRKMALKYHPDRNPGDKQAEEKFKEAAEAYSVLNDPEKRSRYDQFGHAGVQNGAGFDPTIFSDFSDILGDFFGFENIFGDVFGTSSRHRSRTQRGADLRYDLTISLEEAASGLKTKLKIPRYETCSGCHGSGAAHANAVVNCTACHGRGQVRYQQGFFTISRTCSHCEGTGKIIKERCKDCRGQGRIKREKILEVKIPPGVDKGSRLRIQGEGEGGANGGRAGDLYVVIDVEDHPFFQRQESNLYCQVPIGIVQAVLGGEIVVPTLDGQEKLKIPEGTQPGSSFRLRGKGMPNLTGGRGDLIVIANVIVPTKLSKEERRLFEELGKVGTNNPDSHDKNVFDRVKDIFH